MKANLSVVMDHISKGGTRNAIVQAMVDEGMSHKTANKLYYEAMKEMTPDSNLFDEYKLSVMHQNLDRLERIIHDCIDGDTQDKKLALSAIAELNKMIGASGGNTVAINRKKEGDEEIIISFDR